MRTGLLSVHIDHGSAEPQEDENQAARRGPLNRLCLARLCPWPGQPYQPGQPGVVQTRPALLTLPVLLCKGPQSVRQRARSQNFSGRARPSDKNMLGLWPSRSATHTLGLKDLRPCLWPGSGVASHHRARPADLCPPRGRHG